MAGVLKLGTKTRYGRVAAIHTIKGERYYFMVDDGRLPVAVAMMPAYEMERHDRPLPPSEEG